MKHVGQHTTERSSSSTCFEQTPQLKASFPVWRSQCSADFAIAHATQNLGKCLLFSSLILLQSVKQTLMHLAIPDKVHGESQNSCRVFPLLAWRKATPDAPLPSFITRVPYSREDNILCSAVLSLSDSTLHFALMRQRKQSHSSIFSLSRSSTSHSKKNSQYFQ